jgi:transglutaminase/protease-like cytokinesis protein 3
VARKTVKRKAKPKPKAKAGGSKAAVINKYSKSSGIAKSTLSKVYSRGLGAYYSSGSRPGVGAHQWAAGRVRSFATGRGGARKADADLIRGKKKTTRKKATKKK